MWARRVLDPFMITSETHSRIPKHSRPFITQPLVKIYFSLFSCRFDELRRSEASIDMDGLNTLTYNVLDYQEMPLYTIVSVSLRWGPRSQRLYAKAVWRGNVSRLMHKNLMRERQKTACDNRKPWCLVLQRGNDFSEWRKLWSAKSCLSRC